MENRAHALLAGAFTLALLIASVLIALWLRGDRHDQVPYELTTKLSIAGLNPQAAVRYRGLDVGKVEGIGFDPQVPGQILVKIRVKPDTPITKSTYGTLGYQGVTGIAYVQLDDDGSEPARLPSSDKQIARIEMRPSLLDNLQSRGLAILNQAEEVSKRINNLLAPANQQRMLNAFDNVSKAADQIEAIPRQLQPTLAKLPAVAEQTNRALNSVTLLANNLNTLTTTLQGPDGAVAHLTTTLDQMGAVVNKLEVEALPLVNDMRSTLRGFNRTLDTVREHPQSLLLGVTLGEPGPGESGFEAPKK
ncbi:MAG: MCE family protein [Burkholderiales bacterium]|nr:MCE family protein [Burkholderiales bacterium]